MTDTKYDTATLDEAAEQKAAVDIVNQCVAMLRKSGYEFAVVGVSKLVIRADGKFSLPGATVFETDRSCAPAFPGLARTLRTLADQLDEAFQSSGASESPQGYAHLVESVRDAKEPPSLVKDFHVLYRLTECLVADMDDAWGVDVDVVRAQLRRLRPAFEQCEAARRMAQRGSGRDG